MEPIYEIAVILILSGLLSVVAFKMGLLTLGGAVTSFFIGIVVGIFGGLYWFILLILFVSAGFAATKMDFSKKKKSGLQEGDHGERTYKNILGVGLAPCILAVIAFLAGDENRLLTSIGFIASISVASADTLASEIGVRDKVVWLCTTMERVPPGTNGGISAIGTSIALLGATTTSVLGWIVLYRELDILLVIPIIAGMTGCYLDSVFGATIEDKGLISKYSNNAMTAIFGAALAMLISSLLI